ncbi:hypothetical protein QN277_001126 [Acacia crassicarpa]|uniref:Uncharacterized protein n=1 Tax=Acacia crassicarpa TaxID=499986 RepID=A0AAE1TGR1_9FABA|nr:hypothetical protein QN277_001126 [Acacia crassicarpa]
MFPPTNNNCSNYFFPSSSSYSFPLLHHPSAFENNNASSSSLPSAAANATFYHHDHLSSLPFIPTLIPEALTNNLAAPSEYASVGRQQNIAPDCNVVSGNFIANKKPSSKKDRHSKIYTSQGLRDRRVRLSIEIARKFFDLQDMLGFDKASNTLDWLFTKSKKEIQELEKVARSKKKSSSTSKTTTKSFSSPSESEEVVSPQGVDSDSGKATRPETTEKAKKESRVKARARARERANHKGKSLVVVCGAETSESIRREEHNKKNQQCTVIKRKMKQPCNLMNSSNHLQEHFLIPNHKEASFTNNTTFINTTSTTTTHDYSIFPNLTPNWDTNGPSNFRAIADMNLSTDLQIYGKSWEECNNQRRH